MEINLVAGDIAKVEADAVVVNVFRGVEQPSGATAGLNPNVQLLISRIAEAKNEEVI